MGLRPQSPPRFSHTPQERLRWSSYFGPVVVSQVREGQVNLLIQTVEGLGDTREGRVGLVARSLTVVPLNLSQIL